MGDQPGTFANADATSRALRVLNVNGSGAEVSPGGDATAAKQDQQTAALGTTADVDATGNGSIIGILKRLRTLFGGGLPAALGAGGGLKVDGTGTALPVSGTVTANAGTGTLAVSAASLPLPAGAATAAKQPALGTAGAASADVITVQGVAAGTALAVAAGGYTALSAVEFVRPADVTAYSLNDAISDSTTAPTVLTFTNASRAAGGSGYVVRARLMTDQSANVAAYRLHLFRATATAINDNAAYTNLIANRANYLGYIDFPAATTEGTGSDSANSQNLDTRLAFVATGTSLFGLLQTKTAFTPASGQRYYVELGIEQN